ncbi:AlphaAlpha-latrotoxin-Lh1a, partial [Argonauta hians]
SQELYLAVRQLNPDKTRDILYGDTLISEQQDDLFNILISGLVEKPSGVAEATKLVYLLRNAGLNINHPNAKDGSIPLLTYLQNGKEIDANFIEALLRCNADVYAVNQAGINVLDELSSKKSTLQNNVKEVFEKYMPGMWNAVENDDLMSVRRLVNQWCRTDIEKNGKTLVQLAIERGIENMDRLVSEINPSMDLAHGVLADDIILVSEIIESKKPMNMNFRNGGDQGATPIYYALCNNNFKITDLLIAHGARLDTTLSDGDEFDIPLLFAVLMKCSTSHISPELIRKIIPNKPENLSKLFYRGQNVILHCIDYLVPKEIVEVILEKGCANLITAKNKFNLNSREYAAECDATYVVEAIDKAVFRWCFESKTDANFKLLALHEYRYFVMPLENKPSGKNEESTSVSKKAPDHNISAFHHFDKYQDKIKLFVTAVVEGDVEDVSHNLFINDPELSAFEPCLAGARYKGDGQPVLHKAVLRCYVPIVRTLVHTLVYKNKLNLDSLRDQFYRTALHYAYGMPEDNEISNILIDYGCSEFTVDKDGRSPLSFKDRRNQKSMADLLEYQLKQNLAIPEPNPWASPLPLPIIGYLMDCQDGKHFHKFHSSRMKALSYTSPSSASQLGVSLCSSSSSSGGGGGGVSGIGRTRNTMIASTSSSCEQMLSYPADWSLESSDDEDSEISERDYDEVWEDEIRLQAEKTRKTETEGRWNYMASYASYASPYCSIL